MGKKETRSIPPEYQEKLLNWKQMSNVERGKIVLHLVKDGGVRLQAIANLVGVTHRRVYFAREAYEASLGRTERKEIWGIEQLHPKLHRPNGATGG